MSTSSDNWTPPKNPDPSIILNEARADARAKRYKIALAKHVWYHNHALSISQAQFGVRLSFALSYWYQLGQEYPPAMAKLRSVRDGLEKQARKGENLDNAIPDLAAISRTLGEDSRTTSIFKVIDKTYPEKASMAFLFVNSALIKEKEYKLYGKYVEPNQEYVQMKYLYELNQERAKDPKFGANLSEYSGKSFREPFTTLIAILVVNNRKAEANEIVTRAKKEVPNEANNPQFQEELKSALAGIVPKPWP